MARFMALFGAALTLAYIGNLGLAFRASPHPAAVVSLLWIVALWAVPFFLAGMVVSLALTRSSLPTGKLYAADLAGAALGCLLVQPALSALGPPASLGVASLLLLLGARWLASGAPSAGSYRTAWGATALLVFIAAAALKPTLFSPRWVKGNWEPRRERIFWNAYSRVAVYPPETSARGKGRGLGRNLPAHLAPVVRFRKQDIDATSTTWITEFDGDLRRHQYLSYDAVNIASHLRTGGSLAVIGAGGGRDILAALVMGQKRVVGIEMNATLVRLLQQDYADFAGHLATWPGVQVEVAEARNWLERCAERFDVIQVSFTDTWAAAASGAFALTENNLYTVEAWRTFFSRLKSTGLLSVSRFYSDSAPMETYRLAALAQASLTAYGQRDPAACVAVVANRTPGSEEELGGMATILVSPSPLSRTDGRTLDHVAARCGFAVLYSPFRRTEPFATLLDPTRSPAWQRTYFLDVSPPRDDRPHFLLMLRFHDLLNPKLWRRIFVSQMALLEANFVAVLVLGLLGLALVTAAVALTIVPLRLHEGRGVWQGGDIAAAAYFAAIGLAFMMVEIAIIQRTSIILGHPIYGLQVTLFSLLLGTGLGSLLSTLAAERTGVGTRLASGFFRVGFVIAPALAVLSLGPLSAALSTAPQLARILAVATVVFTVGLFMGAPFPAGVRAARAMGRDALLPWFWGLNGVCSVLGAFLGTTCSIFAGARFTGLLGAACYALAWLAMRLPRRCPRLTTNKTTIAGLLLPGI